PGVAPSAALAPPGDQRARLLRAVAGTVVVRPAEALRQHRLAAAGFAADGARSRRTPATPAQTCPETAREIAGVDGGLQRALDALRDDLAQLGPDLLAEALHPFPHAGSSASACHRGSDRYRKSIKNRAPT